MCRAVKCRRCGKTSWTGCGAHVDAVMSSIAADDRCRCEASERKPAGLLSSLIDLVRGR
jgi:hypothetical protein